MESYFANPVVTFPCAYASIFRMKKEKRSRGNLCFMAEQTRGGGCRAAGDTGVAWRSPSCPCFTPPWLTQSCGWWSHPSAELPESLVSGDR